MSNENAVFSFAGSEDYDRFLNLRILSGELDKLLLRPYHPELFRVWSGLGNWYALPAHHYRSTI